MEEKILPTKNKDTLALQLTKKSSRIDIYGIDSRITMQSLRAVNRDCDQSIAIGWQLWESYWHSTESDSCMKIIVNTKSLGNAFVGVHNFSCKEKKHNLLSI